jgi:hypothetical protein
MAVLPSNANVTGGIRNFGELYNQIDGDCVCAATGHNSDCKGTTLASRWQNIKYLLGFKPVTAHFTLGLYTSFLKSLGEAPGPDMGVNCQQWFPWLKENNFIVEWGMVNYKTTALKQAMIDYRGVVLTLSLTPNAYQNFPSGEPWEVGPGDQPDPSLGHAIMLCEYTPELLTSVTWGRLQSMTYDFWKTCGNGAFVFVSSLDQERLGISDYADLVAKTAALPKA